MTATKSRQMRRVLSVIASGYGLPVLTPDVMAILGQSKTRRARAKVWGYLTRLRDRGLIRVAVVLPARVLYPSGGEREHVVNGWVLA